MVSRKKPDLKMLFFIMMGVVGLAYFYEKKMAEEATLDDFPQKVGNSNHPDKKMDKSSGRAIAQQNQADGNDQPELPVSNDPIIEVLKQYEIDPKNQLKVDYDRWFVSDKYVQIAAHEYKEDMGKIINKVDNEYIVEPSGNYAFEDFPPLVISHSTLQPVVITGDLFVKYPNMNERDEVRNYLQSLADSKIIENESLSSVSRLQVSPDRKGRVLQIYREIKSNVDSQNSVEFDVRHHFKTI